MLGVNLKYRFPIHKNLLSKYTTILHKKKPLVVVVLSSNLSWDKLTEHMELCEYEAKAYLSLVTNGACEAGKLSMLCGVPRTKIYGTLRKLIERGLVVEVCGEPKKFLAVTPSKALNTYLQSAREKTSNKVLSLIESDRIISLLEEAYQKANVGSRSEKGELWVIRSRSEIMRTIREMLNRARISINVVTTANGLILFYKATNKLLDKLVDEGVAIKIETNIGSLNGSLAKELNYICEVKNANVPSSMLFLCVDRQEIIVSQLKPDDFNTESDEDVGFFLETRPSAL